MRFNLSLKSGVRLMLVTSVLFLVACSKDSKKEMLNPLLTDSQNIISTRPQSSTQFVAILKLKNNALMQSAQKKQGKVVIDPRLLAEIIKEQDETIAALKNLSSDIQVIYRYKMVLNGLAVLAPIEFADRLKALGQIAYSEKAGDFSMPKTMDLTSNLNKPSFLERNSAQFIGAEKLNAAGITGKGIKVGIIDTGIDYTHAMFKGVGTEEAYKAIDPDKEATGFPSEKVVGGIDLVGTHFDSASPEFSKHIPKPDMNPLDQGGHGSHVAGTVAGLGDGVNTYNGMAPDALLYAIKVFGAEGSTSDSVVIAALEYSADPNGDGDNADQLDIVNMSLGSGYGNPHILYSEAIKNLVNGGTVVVASAGNSGHKDYIVSAPGSTTEAFSVAASVDNGDQNWKFNSSKILIGAGENQQTILVEAIEAATSKKIADAGAVTGKLVYAGLALEDFSDEQAAALKGHVALLDRGQVNFNDKLKRAAKAGVIGVVMVNNTDGAPIAMGTTDKFDFPAIMIRQVEGKKVKEALKNADAAQAAAVIEFQAPEKIEKPELIDTLTDFTSKGPRSIDGFLKPEIAAPGNNVISAKMGGGAKAVQMSGTSMAAPHMAGVMALVKQAHPDLTAEELKSIVMGTALTIAEKGERYSVTLQGSGRVQADKAAESMLVVEEPSISLGEMAVEAKKAVRRSLTLKNLSAEDTTLFVSFDGNGFISMNAASTVTVKAKSTLTIPMTLTMDATKMKDESIREMDGWVKFTKGADVKTAVEVYRVPVLAIAHKLSAIQAESLTVQASSNRDADGALAELTLNNANQNKGQVLLFNLLGRDDRKPSADSYMTADCDLQASGYRLINRKDEQGQDEQILQIAIKTYKPMTTWNSCDISVMIDADQDGIAEQELLGSTLKSIPGQTSDEFASTLIDATKARQIRKDFEAALLAAKDDPKKLAELKDKEKYDAAFVDQKGMTLFNNSTAALLEASVSALAKTKEGNLALKLVVTHNEQSSVQMDDYLNQTFTTNLLIALKNQDQAFVDLPEVFTLESEQTQKVELTKGSANGSLLVLMPDNKFSVSDLVMDAQAQIVEPQFKVP
jgi:minor extracellular serine protease Vpr